MSNNEINKLKIDLFLKQIQLLSRNNPLGPKHIYYQLVSQGMPEEEVRRDLSEEFEMLQQNNRGNDKLEVFVAGNWPYFCQFLSKESWRAHEMNAIKIYVPLKKQNITTSVQKIFDFINQNNIEHCSKLARETRIDDLVIRVFRQEDADKIISFINNDRELTNNMYEANPFTITSGKVGLAMDRILSYNDTVAQYIYNYIKNVNASNKIASVTGFKQYLQENLIKMQEKSDLSLQVNMCSGKNYQKLPKFLQTVEEITSLLIKVTDGAPTETLYEEFQRVNNPEYMEQQQEAYQEFDYVEMENNNRALLKELFKTMSYKYGYNRTIETLMEYKKTGDVNFITRTNNLRDRVAASKTFRTSINCINLEATLKSMIPRVEPKEIKPSKDSVLEEACKQTYISCQTEERNYCGKIQVARALIRMMYGDYNCITRTNNSRKLVAENVRPEEIKQLVLRTLEANGYIIENEQDLFELYATHIEHICEAKNRERSGKTC